MAAEASAAVTSMLASTLAISVGLGVGVGVGVGLGEGFEDEPEDPHALTKRPAIANAAITPPAETVLVTADWIRAAPERLTLTPVSQGDDVLSSRSNRVVYSERIRTSTVIAGGKQPIRVAGRASR